MGGHGGERGVMGSPRKSFQMHEGMRWGLRDDGCCRCMMRAAAPSQSSHGNEATMAPTWQAPHTCRYRDAPLTGVNVTLSGRCERHTD